MTEHDRLTIKHSIKLAKKSENLAGKGDYVTCHHKNRITKPKLQQEGTTFLAQLSFDSAVMRCKKLREQRLPGLQRRQQVSETDTLYLES